MNNQSDGDKQVSPAVQSQSGTNYYRPVDSQANEVAENSSAPSNTLAEQPISPVEQPMPSVDITNPVSTTPENPAKHFADLPSLSLPSAENSGPSNSAPTSNAAYTPPAPSAPAVSTVPSVPTMSAEPLMPTQAPTQKFSAQDSAINAPESPAQIAQKMKTANKKTGGGALKAILTIVLATVLVVVVWFAYNWYQSSTEPTPIAFNQDQDAQNNSQSNFPTDLEEDKVEVEISEDASSLSEIPLTSYVQLTTASAETAEVSGTVCPFAGEAKAGIIAFYEVDTKQLYKSDMTSQNNVFTVNIPAGRYLTIFEPTEIDLPNFAYTEYVRCGLDPNECTDHSLSVYQVNAGETYGQIRVCDPQYNQEGLPAYMQFEYDAL